MRKEARFLSAFLTASACFTCMDANAWFFFFIPGGVISGISDAVTGAKGDICVRNTAKVGDVSRSVSGNTSTIKSLSGTSSRCPNPDLPIRAEVEFAFTYSTKAGISLSDDYEARPITDLQRFNGRLLTGVSKSIPNKGIIINSRKRESNTDPIGIANALEKGQIAALIDAKSSNAEQLTIQGAKAWRFEVSGKLKGLFGQSVTYLVTVIEGDDDILVVNAYAPTSHYADSRSDMRKLADGLTGIRVSREPPPGPDLPGPRDRDDRSPEAPSDSATTRGSTSEAGEVLDNSGTEAVR